MPKLGLIIIFIMVFSQVSFSLPYTDWFGEAIPDSNTLALWNFNESDIHFVADQNCAYDKVLNNWVHATFINSPAQFVDGGKYGFGLSLPFTTSGNESKVEVGHEIFPVDTDPSLSVSMWIKSNNLTHTLQYLIDKKYTINGGFLLYLYHDNSMNSDVSNIVWTVGSSTSTQVTAVAQLQWETDNWYHIAATWNADTDTAHLYRDGTEIASAQVQGMVIANNSSALTIGQRAGSSYGSFAGFLDDVKISNKAYEYAPVTADSFETIFSVSDLNYDYCVDLLDLEIIVQEWLSNGEPSSPVAVDVNAFFSIASDLGLSYDPNKIYPAGRIFPAAIYSVYGADITNLKSDGFTIIGPYYGNQSQTVNYARAAGLKCFYTVGYEWLGIDPYWDDHDFVMPSDAEITSLITSQINAVAHNNEIAGWYLVPEEIRWWRANEVHFWEVATNAVKAADPYHRPVWTYEALNRDTASLVKTVIYQDYCGKGMYVNFSNYKDSRIFCKWSIDQEIGALTATGSTAVPLALPEMFEDPLVQEVNQISTWTRHDSYLGLISGAKGIVVYSGYRRSGFTTFDQYYEGYAEVLREINGSRQLGQVFLFGEKREDLQITVLSGPETVTFSDFENNTHIYKSVNFYNAAYGQNAIGSDRYLFVVNSAEQPVQIRISGLPLAKVQCENLTTGKICTFGGNSFDLNLSALEVINLRIFPMPCNDLKGDLTGESNLADCVVNLKDLSIMTSEWHDCTNP